MAWTDERIKQLRQLWSEGQSASKIAEKLGGVTRNAVIGKIHRLGLSNRSENSEKKIITKKRGRPAKVKNTDNFQEQLDNSKNKDFSKINSDKFDELHVDDLENNKTMLLDTTLANIAELEKNAKKLNLMELTERTCKWPIGDPATENFWFCGHPSEQGKPYCSTHVSIAFQPISLKRERKAK